MSRDILAPPLQRMGTNRCYRVNLVHEDFGGPPAAAIKNQQKQDQGYVEQDLYGADDDECDEETEGVGCTIEELATGMVKLTFHVAQAFYGGLIGFKGSTKRRIETETKTEIYVPGGRGNSTTKAEEVTIKGKSRSSVLAAKRKITLLIHSLRKRMRPTHFLCVSTSYSAEVRENFIKFRQEVLDANLPGIDEHMFQGETKIHLTLNTCVLLDDAERAKALEVLQNCREFLSDLKTPFEIKIAGLEIMNDDPSAVRVLYARIESPDLQKFANSAFQRFLQSGLAFDEHDRPNGTVKLHMTLMNMRYAEAAAAKNFDAREILKRFGDFEFGTAQCGEVQLCVLGSSKGKEFYKVTGNLKL